MLKPNETPEKTIAKVLHDWKYDSITDLYPSKTDTLNITNHDANRDADAQTFEDRRSTTSHITTNVGARSE
jgi:hypothetical protein